MEPAEFYHIYNHANGHENLFSSDENYRYFLQQWARHINPIADPYAYCLMPNHFHFLVKIKSESLIPESFQVESSTRAFGKFETFRKLVSKQFSNFFSSYTQAYNKMHNRKGSLFLPNFKRKKITSDSYLTNIIFYIHHNRIHHSFSTKMDEWKHSSYHSLISEKQTLLQRKQIRKWFGSAQEFKKFHCKPLQHLSKLELEFA